MKTSCILHPKRERLIVIHEWQIKFCFGNQCAAALLSFFEYWHNIRLDQIEKSEQANQVAKQHGETGGQDVSLWQFHTEKQLSDGILVFKPTAIGDALKLLESLAVIEISRNPNPRYKFDRTRFFRFHPEIVNHWLLTGIWKAIDDSSEPDNRSVKNDATSVESDARSNESDARCVKSDLTIPEITTEITSKTTTESEGQQPAPAPLNSKQQLPPATATAQQPATPKVTVKAAQPLTPSSAAPLPPPWQPVLDMPPTKRDIVADKLNGSADLSPARLNRPSHKSPHVRVKMLDADGYFPAGQGNNPVEMYYERFSAFDPKTKLIAPKETDLMTQNGHPHMREIMEFYGQSSYQPGNVNMILRWCREGLPSYKKGTNNGKTSNGIGAVQTNDYAQTGEFSPAPKPLGDIFTEPEPGEYGYNGDWGDSA